MAIAISVVTGAAGFLGLAITRRLLAEGDTVRAVVLRGDPAVAELRTLDAPGLEIFEGDVTDYASIAPAFPGAARVFHTAALVHAWAPWERFRAINVGGTQNVARAALEHGVGRMVLVSTTDVFGIPGGRTPLTEESPFLPWNEPYADTKIEAEKWLWQFHRESGLPVSVIYPGWIYGPGDRAFFPGLAEAIRRGFLPMWFRGVRLEWAYIDNMVDACVLASTHPAAAGNGYIIHDGLDGPTLEEVCGRIADAIGAKRPSTYIPYGLALAAASICQAVWRIFGLKEGPPLRTVDVKAFGANRMLSNEKARRELGWTPRVGFEEGMRRALEALELAVRAP